MPTPIKKLPKAPYELLDYAADYTKELAKDNDTIASSLWIAPSDTVDGPGNAAIKLADNVTVNYDADNPSPVYSLGGVLSSATKSYIYLKGGTMDKEYLLENRIITAKGRRYSRSMIIKIQPKSS
jgi:hypothetical protein